VAGASSYAYYRLEMMHNGVDSYGGTILQLSELELFGSEGTTPVELENILANCGDASAQYNDSPTNEGVSNLTDGSPYSKFLTFHASSWVQVNACRQYVVSNYAMTSANDAAERDPQTWSLSGSTDGVSWTILDSRSNQDFSSRYQRREFTFTNSQAYQYYRLAMTNNSGSILQLADLEIFGYATASSGLKSKASVEKSRYLKEKLEMKIWPNPANDYLTIYFSEEVKGSIQLYAVGGTLVASIDKFVGESERIAVNHLPAGVYILVIRTVNGVFNQQVVVN